MGVRTGPIPSLTYATGDKPCQWTSSPSGDCYDPARQIEEAGKQ